ncbi:MAG TPA: tyrosine-type recombinase/integrase, partial [Ktedonosporobacter sp.]|nr:tyrosine-type recombinase/integrase [Ktedonosporobacter sp.]
TRFGNYVVPNNVRRWFDEALAAAGLAHMKFHGLRHNASLILRNLGIDPVVRKEMLGHSRLDMTDGVYGHTTPKMHKKAAEEINRVFGSEEEKGKEDESHGVEEEEDGGDENQGGREKRK